MNTRIEICTKEDESTTVKGGILERLVAQILTVQQFEVTQTVRVTGIEIDVYAKHKITNQVILAEHVIVGNIPDTYYNFDGVGLDETLNVIK